MATIETNVRLYVGGLPSQITAKQLEGRFATFGKVSAINVIPSKAQSADLSCRGFAYVEFCPKDHQSLQRCLSLYNGCKWLGGVLKVEKAKEHYLARLQREKEAEFSNEEQRPQSENSAVEESPSAESLRIPTPASGFVKRKLMTVKPGPVKRMFAPYKGQRLSELSWDPLPTPPGLCKRKAAEMAAASFSLGQAKEQPPSPTQQHNAMPATKLQSNAAHQYHDEPHAHQQQQPKKKRKGGESAEVDAVAVDGSLSAGQVGSGPAPADAVIAIQQQKEAEAEVQNRSETPESSSDIGVVDFVSDEDVGESVQGVEKDTDYLARFDDSDDELMPTAMKAELSLGNKGRAQQQHQSRPAPISATTASAAADTHSTVTDLLARSDDSDNELMPAGVTAEFSLSNIDDAQQHDQLQTAPISAPHATAVADAHSKDSGYLARFDDSDDELMAAAVNAERPLAENDDAQERDEVQTALLSADADADAADDNARVHLTGDGHLSTGRQQTAAMTSAVDLSRFDDDSTSQSESDDNAALLSVQLSELGSASEEASESDSASASDAASEPDLASASEAASEPELASDLQKAHDSAPHFSDTDDILQAAADRADTDSASSDSHVSEVMQASDMPADDAEQAAAEANSDSEGASADVSEGETAQQHSSHDLATQPAAELKLTEQPANLAQTSVSKLPTSANRQDAEPTYPDLVMLQAGAAFWHQNKTISEKSWQAQRQILHADYKAKHRAAAKHAQKGRKSRFG